MTPSGIFLLAALITVGCATTRPAARAPASLRVVNATTSAADVFLDGYLVGTAAPGRARILVGLAPGESQLRVSSQDGGPVLHRRIGLEEGRQLTVGLYVSGDTSLDAKRQESDAPPAASGSLELKNPYPYVFDLSLDGSALGALFENGSRRFDGINPGDHELVVRSSEGLVRARMGITISPSATTALAVRIPTGQIELVNGLDEPLHVEVDGNPSGSVTAKTSRILAELPVGRHVVIATGDVSLRRYRVEAGVVEDTRRRIDLAGAPGDLLVTNRAREAFALALDDTAPRNVDPGAAISFRGLQPGTHKLSARGVKTSARLFHELRVEQGESFAWDLIQERGAVQVSNETSERQVVIVDGLEAVQIAPFRQAELPSLVVGERELLFVGATSQRRVETTARVTPVERSVVRILPSANSLALLNKLDEAVRIYRDGRFLTELGALDSQRIERIAGGDILLEALGLRSGRVYRERLSFSPRPGAAASVEKGVPQSDAIWIIREAKSVLRITNQSGEALRAPPELSGSRRSIYDGETGDFTLLPGPRLVKLIGERTGFVYGASFPFPADTRQDWNITTPQGSLQVFNYTSEDAVIQVNGETIGEVKADGFVVFTGIAAGTMEAFALFSPSGQQLRREVTLQPGQRRIWELERGYARVLVINERDESVGLEIDGAIWTTLGPRERRLLSKVVPGRRQFVAIGVKTNSRSEATLDARTGQDTRWVIAPQLATLLVENRSPEALRVDINGQIVGRVEIGGAQAFPVRSGDVRLVFTGLDSLEHMRSWLFLHPDRSVDMLVRHLAPRFVIVNRLGRAQSLWMGDEGLGVLGPGESLTFDRVCPTEEAQLHAVAVTAGAGSPLLSLGAPKAPKGGRRVSLPCRANEQQTWIIQGSTND